MYDIYFFITYVYKLYYFLRPKPDTPTYENVDLTKCPPRLHPKPTTPISPPTPQHSEIIHDHHFFPCSTGGMNPLLEGNNTLTLIHNYTMILIHKLVKMCISATGFTIFFRNNANRAVPN